MTGRPNKSSSGLITPTSVQTTATSEHDRANKGKRKASTEHARAEAAEEEVRKYKQGKLSLDSLASVVTLQHEDGGPDKRGNTVEAFEFFLEVTDEAKRWNKEGGRLSFQLSCLSNTITDFMMSVWI